MNKCLSKFQQNFVKNNINKKKPKKQLQKNKIKEKT